MQKILNQKHIYQEQTNDIKATRNIYVKFINLGYSYLQETEHSS